MGFAPTVAFDRPMATSISPEGGPLTRRPDWTLNAEESARSHRRTGKSAALETTGRGKVYGPGIDDAVAAVQAVLDEHVGASAGRCGVCGGPDMCGPYVNASKAFAWSGHLPRRRPGATLSGATERGSWPGWLPGPGSPRLPALPIER
jgi:hypothetical protein